MKTNRTIILLKIAFGFTLALCLFQLILPFLSKTNMLMQTYFFAIRIPITTSDTTIIQNIAWYLFGCTLPIYFLVGHIILKLIGMLKLVNQQETPFTMQSVKVIKAIGIKCVFSVPIIATIQYVCAQVLMQSIKPAFQNWRVEFSFPMEWAIIGIALICFAKVFEYGLLLKQDNDSII